MQFKKVLLLAGLALLFSCADAHREAEKQRDLQKKEQVFEQISRDWHFASQPSNPTATSLVATWEPWRDLLREMEQKPQSSIGAFQKKAKTLSEKVALLSENIPAPYNIPSVKSRIAVLSTKINELQLFLNLDQIPTEKVSALIRDTNTELSALQNQFHEITRRAQVKQEWGERDLFKMRDTARAIPDGFDPNLTPNAPKNNE